MTAPDVRPARARDLPLLTGLADDLGRDEMVLVASDPPIGFAHVAFPDGQAHLTQLAVWADWDARGSRRTDDGSAHHDMQLNVMNHRLVEFVAQDTEREQLAGDQLFLDLDLSHDNLPAWSRLTFGDPASGGAVIEVTEEPHNGCAKFIARFGKDAMTFVNGPEGKPRRLRGLCARVVQAGAVRPGDIVRVTRPTG